MSDHLTPSHPAAVYYPGANDGRARVKDLTVMGAVAFAVATATTLMGVVNVAVVGTAVRHGGSAGYSDWSVVVYDLTEILFFVGLLAGWVSGSLWLGRARANAETITPTYAHTRAAGWAWGGWLVPIVALWFPFQVVRDVRFATLNRPAVWPLVGWWWGLWLAMSIGYQIYFEVADDQVRDGGGAVATQALATVWAVLLVAALVLWGLVLKTITSEQHAAARRG